MTDMERLELALMDRIDARNPRPIATLVAQAQDLKADLGRYRRLHAKVRILVNDQSFSAMTKWDAE